MNKVDWKDFEFEAAEYLKTELDKYNIKVEHKGGHDSTVPDIKIIKKDRNEFYVEAKIHSAQSSQFVVKIENKHFKYSDKNKYPSNIFCEEIIQQLNDNFDTFSIADQSGLTVPIPDLLATNCIIKNMENKNVKYIITIDKHDNKRIIPINDFQYFFNIITKLRTKKSGSRSISGKYMSDFKEKFQMKFPNEVPNIKKQGKKYYVTVNKNLSPIEKYIPSEKLPGISQYYLSAKDNNIFEIRITGNTDNANIIFEIKSKFTNIPSGYNIETFKSDIIDE